MNALDYSEFDALQAAVDYGHQIGLKIYAWASINEDDHGWGWRSEFAKAHPDREMALRAWLYTITRNACVDRLRRAAVPDLETALEQSLARFARKGNLVMAERVRAQLEGAAVMAVGLARSAEITAANGRVQQGNFNDFHVARITDAPALVDTHIIESDDKPGGVGEPGLPPVVPALPEAARARPRAGPLLTPCTSTRP